ncbi:hypothetical protein I6B53_09640 [Schaalia sp. 19OD2882]|uniref:hypothetical protein n=1 Tax=Schaalia sp. 19OD2882 TaxID=2794089 RepID=UPI001C1EC16E|nr:hypothetical protein [Schaalia sp. 19OD2882]QWW19343.1 hypothetical protein I6B53_09640 [Schaalia sp. 19OD2882]
MTQHLSGEEGADQVEGFVPPVPLPENPVQAPGGLDGHVAEGQFAPSSYPGQPGHPGYVGGCPQTPVPAPAPRSSGGLGLIIGLVVGAIVLVLVVVLVIVGAIFMTTSAVTGEGTPTSDVNLGDYKPLELGETLKPAAPANAWLHPGYREGTTRWTAPGDIVAVSLDQEVLVVAERAPTGAAVTLRGRDVHTGVVLWDQSVEDLDSHSCIQDDKGAVTCTVSSYKDPHLVTFDPTSGALDEVPVPAELRESITVSSIFAAEAGTFYAVDRHADVRRLLAFIQDKLLWQTPLAGAHLECVKPGAWIGCTVGEPAEVVTIDAASGKEVHKRALSGQEKFWRFTSDGYMVFTGEPSAMITVFDTSGVEVGSRKVDVVDAFPTRHQDAFHPGRRWLDSGSVRAVDSTGAPVLALLETTYSGGAQQDAYLFVGSGRIKSTSAQSHEEAVSADGSVFLIGTGSYLFEKSGIYDANGARVAKIDARVTLFRGILVEYRVATTGSVVVHAPKAKAAAKK